MRYVKFVNEGFEGMSNRNSESDGVGECETVRHGHGFAVLVSLMKFLQK